MVLKVKPESNLKTMLKGSKTIQIIIGSKNKSGLTQVKAMFLHETSKKFWYIMTTRKSTLKNIVSGCAVHSEHRIAILNAKSIKK